MRITRNLKLNFNIVVSSNGHFSVLFAAAAGVIYLSGYRLAVMVFIFRKRRSYERSQKRVCIAIDRLTAIFHLRIPDGFEDKSTP